LIDAAIFSFLMTNVPSKIEQSNADIISHIEASKLHTSVGIIPQEQQRRKIFTPC
jgi:hypothetical protein